MNLLNETAVARDSFSWVQVLTVIVVFAVIWPLQSRLRRAASERRKARWVARDAHQHPAEPGHAPDDTN